MKYLFLKFGRDIKKLWPQFFSVFIMAMISMTIFAGMGCVWKGMQVSSNEYFDDTNLADAWVTCDQVTEDDLETIRKKSYIKDAQQSMTFSVECNYKNKESDIRLTTFSKDTKSVMKPLVKSGSKMYKKGSKDQDGVWIDEDYADANEIKTGDKIEISIANKKMKVPVKGIVLHSENIFFVSSKTDSLPDHERYGYGYINEDYAKSLFGGVMYNQIRIDLIDDSVSKDKLQDDMQEILDGHVHQVSLRDDVLSITRIEDEQMQIKKMSMLFSVVFVLLSLLAMYTTMNRLVNNQTVQIGTMKGMGYFNSQIYTHYACFGLIIALLGGGIGIILGRMFISEIVTNIKKATLSLPEWQKVLPVESFILWAGIVLICTLSALVAVRKVIKCVPAQTIRGNIEKKSGNTKPLKRSKLSYDWLWTLRSIKVHPVRCMMGIIAVAGSIVLMSAGVGVWDSLNRSYDSVFEDEYTYKYAASIKTGKDAEVKQLFSDDNVQYSNSISASFYKNKTKKENDSGSVTVLSEGDMIHLFKAKDGKEIKLPKHGALVTGKIAGKLGIEKGDNIYYKDDDSTERESVEVVDVVDAKMPQGIFISENAWKDEFVPDTVYLGDRESYNIAKDSELLSGVISIKTQRDNMNEMIASVKVVVYILIIAAFVLSSVILYNLGTLNYIERYREYATMKVLGFYKKEMNKMVFKDSLINIIAGLIIGVPASIAFLKLYVSVISMDSMEWVPYIHPVHFIVVTIVIITFCVLIHSVICRKIKKVNMVEALKSIE